MMETHVTELLERGVAALESLAQDPVIQMETGPAVCPSCNKVNPRVRIHEKEAEGELGDFVIQAHCLNCNSVFYALPVQWEVAKSTTEVAQLLRERAEIRGVNG